MTHRRTLLFLAVLLAVVKGAQLAADSQILFYDDSGAFLLNALGFAFIPERSYVYSALIRIFSVSIHSLRAIVAMQVAMGGITAWLLAFVLMRFLSVRPWIAILAALAFAFDPVQIVHERLILAECCAILAEALFVVAAFKYLSTLSLRWLVVVSLAGILLVSLRFVWLPVVLACAVLLPVGAYAGSWRGKPRPLVLALLVSCGAAAVFHIGYRALTGKLAGREPAYHYRTGDFLVTLVAPLIRPADTTDPRIAEAIQAQNTSRLPLQDTDLRAEQMWEPDGFIARLRAALGGDAQAANEAGGKLARVALRRDPLGMLWLGFHTYYEYWRDLPRLPSILAKENGSPPHPTVSESGARMISGIFGVDVSNQHTLETPSRKYHEFGRYWHVFLLLAPLLTVVALRSRASAPLVVWTLLLTASTFWGAHEVGYRYLHPFSFPALAALALAAEACVSNIRSSAKIT